MKALIQRVSQASVKVGEESLGQISRGLVIFVGAARNDTEKEARYLAHKVLHLRIFPDEQGRFNLSALDTRAELLVISQFTLLADTRKGHRPSFTEAAAPETAEPLIDTFIDSLRSSGLKVVTGRFRAHMLVEIHNDGPVTIALDTAKE